VQSSPSALSGRYNLAGAGGGCVIPVVVRLLAFFLLLAALLATPVCGATAIGLSSIAIADSHRLRAGGAVTLEGDRLGIHNLIGGYLLAPTVSGNDDPFKILLDVRGVEGMFLGWRHRFHFGGERLTPFAGFQVLGHFDFGDSYAAAMPETGFSLRIGRTANLTLSLRGWLTTYGGSSNGAILDVGFMFPL